MTDTEAASSLRPFRISTPDKALADLRQRLAATRWPDPGTADDWSQGVPLKSIRALCDYWLHDYDWRRCEAMLNRWPQFITEIDGIDIHFLHIRSPEADALPMMMTHGWPGSILEFAHVIDPLSDPVAHGGQAADAFHLIVPSCPGFGFSGKPTVPGWSSARMAKAWAVLMERLGYDHYVSHGGDLGAGVAAFMGMQAPAGLAAIHIDLGFCGPTPEQLADPTEEERGFLEGRARADRYLRGYSEIQGTRPQTLGYGLADSPVAQAAWIFEKFHDWTTDREGDPVDVFPIDHLLDNITLYWLTSSGNSSARIYWEQRNFPPPLHDVRVPTGYTRVPGDPSHASRRWMENLFHNLIYFEELPRGGHFAAMQEPELFIENLRRFRKSIPG